MESFKFWEQVKRPPETALKKISSGSLSGMTDISPMWRIEKMTELFGPCGIGWGYVPEKFWTEPGYNGETLCFSQVRVWYKDEDKTGEVYGVGGSKLIQYFGTKKYHVSNDEGYKMAMTDAISVALKALGFGADIYAGKWDGSKYLGDKTPPPKQKGEIEKALAAIKNVKTKQELAKIENLLQERSWTDDEIVKIEATLADMREAL